MTCDRQKILGKNFLNYRRKTQKNCIKLKNLNWTSNPEIKEAAERLGIFENFPKTIEPLHIETLDFYLEFEQALEKLGLVKKPKTYNNKGLNEFLNKTLEQNKTKSSNFSNNTLSSENVIEID